MTRFKYIVQNSDEDGKKAVRDLIYTNFNISSRLKKKIKRENLVFVNGMPVKNHHLPQAGDILTIGLPEETSYFPPEDIPLNILYEDDDLLILNKQPGVVVHPTNGNPFHTLANGIMKYMLDTDQQFKIRFVNRLDMGTSGVVVVGKNSHAQDNMTKQMQKGSVEKTYLAILQGNFEDKSGVVDLPIGRPDSERLQRAVMAEGGSPSVTRYEVLEELVGAYSLVQLQLETGRTPQIRVHMAHLGHPVLGDHLYGEEQPQLISRQALHSSSLAFLHPVTGKPIKITAPLPSDMKEALERIQQNNK